MTGTTDRRGARGAVAAGILFVAASVAGGILTGIDIPATEATLAEHGRYFADDAVRNREEVAGVLLLVALPMFLWFLSWLRTTVSGEDPDPLATTVQAAGIAYMTLNVAAGAVGAAVPAAAGEFDAYRIDPSTGLTLATLSFHLWALAVASGAVMIGVASTAALRRGLLPRWLARTSQAAAVLAFVTAIAGVGETLVLLWLLVVPAVIHHRLHAVKLTGAIQQPGAATG